MYIDPLKVFRGIYREHLRYCKMCFLIVAIGNYLMNNRSHTSIITVRDREKRLVYGTDWKQSNSRQTERPYTCIEREPFLGYIVSLEAFI